MTTRILVYDCEILKAIPQRNQDRLDGIEYCEGWRDFENMGISCVGAIEMEAGRLARSRMFLADNKVELQQAIDDADVLVSFNGLSFDNPLLRARGIEIDDAKCYDVLVEIWAASGLGPKFSPQTHGGFSLGKVAVANNFHDKTGNGALAPVDWQRGKYGATIDYCLNDVYLTAEIFNLAWTGKAVICPKTGSYLGLAQSITRQLEMV